MEEPDDGRESVTELHDIASIMGTTPGADGLEPLHPTINSPNQHDRDSARLTWGWIFGPKSPETTASGCSRDHNPTKKRLAEAETPTPLEAQNHSQVVVLASIDLRSQHGRLVSARFNASVRKGVQGSCKRAASQAAGRAYRIVLQRSRPRRGEKEGSKGLPGQNFSKGLVFAFAPGTAYIVLPVFLLSRCPTKCAHTA